MVAVPENAYIVTDDEGEIYLCNARCLCLWSMTLATKPELPEEIRTRFSTVPTGTLWRKATILVEVES